MNSRPIARSRNPRRARIWMAAAFLTTLCASTPGPRRAVAEDPAPAETLATVEAEWGAIKAPTDVDYRRFLARLGRAAGGQGRAKELATAFLAKCDPNDKDAHDVLGHREFAFEVPEEISYRRYPFVRIVEEAGARRWFDDLVPYTAALEAYAKCTAHAKRLADEPAYAALDVARRGIDQDEHFHAYNYDAVFASPYLICYTTKERIDEAALWNMRPDAKAKAWAELDARRMGYKRVLAEKARIYTQVYREFLKRYGEACDLKPLMDVFGGRPDYPAGKRSYREGCPLIVWIFSDRDAWLDYHENVAKESIAPSVLGYHSQNTGWVYAYDHAIDEREEEISVNAEAATLQLLHWFTRQRNEWGRPQIPATYFSHGFRTWFGAVTMAKDRALTFVGASASHLAHLRQLNEHQAAANRKMWVFPLRVLVELEGAQNARTWGVQQWGINPGMVETLYDIQSWALFQFLDQAAEGKYRPVIAQLVNAILRYPRDTAGYAAEAFRKALAITIDDDWKRLETEFEAFYAALAAQTAATPVPPPPALDDWPDYVAPDLEAPTGPPSEK